MAVKVVARSSLSSKTLDREILCLRAASHHCSIIELIDVHFTSKVRIIIFTFVESWNSMPTLSQSLVVRI